MERFIPIIILLIITVIGFIEKRHALKKYGKRLDFAYNYLDKFIDLINEYTSNNRRVNDALYMELTEKVPQMQSDLGAFGIATVVDNLHNMKINNHQFLVNFLPQIRDMGFWEPDNEIMRHRFMSSARACEDMILRYTGDLKTRIDKMEKSLYNPFSCLADGIRWVVWIPLNVLLSCGLLSVKLAYRLKHNIFVKLITAMIMIVGLISSVVTIIVGWEQFFAILMN